MKCFGKEIERLAKGLENVVEGMDILAFVSKDDVPADKKKDVAHVCIVCGVRPEKNDPYCVQITMVGNLINYSGDCGTPTADLLTIKLLLNSIISTKGARFFTMDIANFYLNTPLATQDGWVYVEISKGMYGLPQAGLLAQELLEKHLGDKGYHQSQFTPGLWTSEWQPILNWDYGQWKVHISMPDYVLDARKWFK